MGLRAERLEVEHSPGQLASSHEDERVNEFIAPARGSLIDPSSLGYDSWGPLPLLAIEVGDA